MGSIFSASSKEKDVLFKYNFTVVGAASVCARERYEKDGKSGKGAGNDCLC